MHISNKVLTFAVSKFREINQALGASRSSTDTMNEEYDNVFVCFHIGRGGRYGNPGHKDFIPYVRDFQDLINREFENLYDVTEDEDGNPPS